MLKGLFFRAAVPLSAFFLLSITAEAVVPNAEILLRQYDLNVKSATDSRLNVIERIRVNNDKGTELGKFEFGTDGFSEISSFSGTIENGGKVIKKIRQEDLFSVQYSESFADDRYINLYTPDAPYPYTVEYRYTVSYKKAIVTFPPFFPVIGSDTPVEKASYTITLPAEMKMRWQASSEPVKSADSKVQRYKWEWENYPGFKLESDMPAYLDIIPYAYAWPISFTYEKYSGTQDSWENVGRFIYGIFPADSELPENLKSEIHTLTDGFGDDLGKIRALYNWLREHTHYVSIQLGVGGYSPMPVSKVVKNGYGDCKALSYLMKKMLEEAGIKSEYLIVNTETRDIQSEYAFVCRMNHAMVCIPSQKDTIWMECTNPSTPLGYRHSHIAGHQCLLVTEDGGRLVRVGDIPDSLRSEWDDIKVEIKSDDSLNGSASTFRVHQIRLADDAVPYEKFAALKRKDIVEYLSNEYNCGVENVVLDCVKDNFNDYAGEPGFVPRADIDFHFTSGTFAKSSGDRLILPLVPSSNMAMNYQKTARIHPFVRTSTSFRHLKVEYSIPDGYRAEFVPQSVKSDSDGAAYFIDTQVSPDGNTITVSYSLQLKKCEIPAEAYASYRDFIREHNKRIGASIILKKTQS